MSFIAPNFDFARAGAPQGVGLEPLGNADRARESQKCRQFATSRVESAGKGAAAAFQMQSDIDRAGWPQYPGFQEFRWNPLLEPGADHMRLGGRTAGLLSAIVIGAPAFAADLPAERPQPQRAPAQPQSSWSGTQVGGFTGGSSVSNGFAEPGSNLFFSCIGAGSFGCVSPVTAVPDVETPFNFDKDRLSFT